MKLSLSTDEYIFLSPVLQLFQFSFFIRCCSRALPRYPVDYLIGEIQLTNYAFSYDMICHNLDPLLDFCFLFSFSFFPTCKTDMLVGLGWAGNWATERGGESLISLCMVVGFSKNRLLY